MARPRKQLLEGDLETMSDKLAVRNAVFSLKTKVTSTTGDITVQEMNEIMSDFLNQGYELKFSNAVGHDPDSVQIYACFVLKV